MPASTSLPFTRTATVPASDSILGPTTHESRNTESILVLVHPREGRVRDDPHAMCESQIARQSCTPLFLAGYCGGDEKAFRSRSARHVRERGEVDRVRETRRVLRQSREKGMGDTRERALPVEGNSLCAFESSSQSSIARAFSLPASSSSIVRRRFFFCGEQRCKRGEVRGIGRTRTLKGFKRRVHVGSKAGGALSVQYSAGVGGATSRQRLQRDPPRDETTHLLRARVFKCRFSKSRGFFQPGEESPPGIAPGSDRRGGRGETEKMIPNTRRIESAQCSKEFSRGRNSLRDRDSFDYARLMKNHRGTV
jgi:hypothetical protein